MRRFSAVLSILALAAAAGAAPLPVAEGFPAWSGLNEKNYLYGRELSPSDLRHKVTVVFEIAPTDEKSAKEQLLAAADVAKLKEWFAGKGLSKEPDMGLQELFHHGVGTGNQNSFCHMTCSSDSCSPARESLFSRRSSSGERCQSMERRLSFICSGFFTPVMGIAVGM